MKRLALTVFLMSFALPAAFSAAGQDAEQAKSMQALRELAQGKNVEANVAWLRGVIDHSADPGALATQIGETLLNEQRFEQAQPFLELARQKRPQDGEVAYALGRVHTALHHYLEGFESLAAAEQLLGSGHHPYLHLYLSLVLTGLQKEDAALQRAQQAIDEARGWNDDMAAHAAGSDPRGPLVDLTEFELNLAFVERSFKKTDAALARVDRVIALIGNDPASAKRLAKAWFERAQLLDSKGDFDGARAAFAKQRELAPQDAKGAYEFASFLIRRSDHAAARPLLEQVIALDPDHEGAHYNLARTLLRLGEKTKGEQAMARYRQLYDARIHGEAKLSELRLALTERAK